MCYKKVISFRNWTGSRDTYDDITRKFLDYNRRTRRRSSRSRSRSYGSSKSRSTSPRWSRSRSSSFSRSRSYSRSRSRSYSHSRSRSRSYHRSRSRSPSRRRKARSPRRYYRSKSRSPRKYTRPHYPNTSRMDYPPDYYHGMTIPPYSGSVPPSQPPSHYKGSRPGSYYHEPFPDYDAYPNVGSRYDSSSTGYSSRYRQNYYSDPSRKPPGRDWDPQYGSSTSWKDSHGKRIEALPAGTTPDKPKENSDSDSASKKKDKLKQKKHHHHHRHKEAKKSSKNVEVPKEKKAATDKHNPSTGAEKVKKEGRIVSLSKDKLVIEQVEVLQKDKKHKHKKNKDGESSKKRKKKSSSEDALHGGEVEKVRKKRRKATPATITQSNDDQINKEVVEDQKTQEDHKNPDNPSGTVIETNVEESANDLLDGTLLETDSPAIESNLIADESLQEGSLANSNQNTSTESTNALTNDSALPDDDENISLKEEEEAEEGEIGDDDDDEEDKANELQVQMPEISKWERDDSDSAEETESALDRKPDVEEGKSTLSSDIIQKAEKALLHKALKSAIVENPSRKRQVERPSEDEKTTNSGSRQKSEKASGDKERSKMQERFGLGTFNKLQRNVTIKFGEIRHLKGMPLQNKRSVFVQPAETKKKEDDAQKSETQVKKIKEEPTTRSDSALIKRNAKKQETNPAEKQRHGSISKRDEKGEHKRGDSKEQVSHSSQRSGDVKKEPREKSPHMQTSGNKHAIQESRSSSIKATVKSDERVGKEKLDEDGTVKNKTVSSRESSSRNQTSSKKLDGSKGSSTSDKTNKSAKTKDSTEDESKFEPNYDETSDSDTGAEHDGTHVSKKRKITSEEGRNSKRSKGDENDLEAGKNVMDEGSTTSRGREKGEHKHQRSGKSRGDSGQSSERKKQQTREAIQSYVVAQKKRSDSVSSEASSSSSSGDSDSSSVKKKAQSESTDSDQKHRLKKSKHRRHKKRKHKHKKKKSHRVRERDEVRLSSSIVRR